SDDDGGSGVKGVTVYVSEDGGDWQIWLTQTTATTAVYQGQAGHTYQFLGLATDNAGNREPPPAGIHAPDDGSGANLGALPTVPAPTPVALGTPPAPSPQPSTNPLFVQAQQGIPSSSPSAHASEFQSVLSPFTAQPFATGFVQSHANIGPMGIVVL